jgi:hypothetical protein
MTTYIFKVEHNIPTFSQFKQWGVKEAYPIFNLDLIIYEKTSEYDTLDILEKNGYDYSFTFKITGHYYCCGSSNFELEQVVLDDYDADISTLEKTQAINKIFLENESDLIKVLSNNLKGCLFTDHILIYELLLDSI